MVAPILNQLMVFTHSWVGNWGVAIILMTILLKLISVPFTLAASKSAKRMAKLAEPMKAIKEKYKDNPKKLNEATLNLFKEHKVNPAGGCLPLLLQLPLLWGFFRFTRTGLAMRAAASNPESARLAGIRVGWMIALGWGMAAAIGAVAGMLIAPVVFLDPNMMLSILLYGFAGAVLGGLGSPAGAVAGGFAVGVVENLAGTYIPVIGGELKLPIALVLIVAVLVVKPNGLFGRMTVQRV